MGVRVRREFRMRAVVAVLFALVFLAAAAYGVYGIIESGDIGAPFLVFGIAGAVAQLALAAALTSARAAITGDGYDRPAVTRARRFVSSVLVLLVIGVVVGFIAVTAAVGGALGGLTAIGMIAAFALTADGWRHVRHLG
jgi:hypothetical protein